MKNLVHALYVSLLVVNFASAQTKVPASALPVNAAVKESRVENPAAATKLPVRRVVLYKNGVGYFEHLGHVHGSQDVHIDFTSAQLNDALKSLTVLDLSGGRITGVDYNSEAPLARRLATLRLALGERPSMADFLGALRGARIEVRPTGTAPVAGRLMSVERKTRSAPNWTVETDEISLITDDGDVRSIDLNPSTSVRIAERDLQTEVGKYLGLIASARDQDVRRMTISTTGNGERKLYVSYISEVPIWKTTYRIVLPSRPEKKPLLQGWAIVDNTVGEDWNNVELSLVAGAPHSFIQQLSEPFYGRRPVIALPESVQLAPQTHSATLLRGNGTLIGTVTDPTGAPVSGTTVRLLNSENGVIAQTTSDSSGQYSFSSQPAGTYRVELDSQGFQKVVVTNLNLQPGTNRIANRLKIGSVSETVEVSAGAPQLNTTSSAITVAGGRVGAANRPHAELSTNGRNFISSLSVAPGAVENSIAASEIDATGQGLGDLFEYKLKDHVTLNKNQSALVPIIQTELQAEKVSLWSGTSGSGRPLRGLWLKNTSDLTFDGGSFSILDNEVFAGEGITDPIKPGERRILSYATDLGMLVQAQTNGRPQHVTRIKLSKGVLTQISELQERTQYTVRNEDTGARNLIIEHPWRTEWTLVKGSKQPEEQAAGIYRFKMEVPAKATATLPIEEAHIQSTTYEVSDLDNDQIALFLKQQTITPEMGDALHKITDQKAVVAKLEAEMELRQKDIDRIVDDQGRLRENMKALRGSAEEKALLQRYTHQLDEQETRLESLRRKIQETEAERDRQNEVLEKMIDDLQLEATL